MALNFSRRPIFPTRLSEDKLGSPIRVANGYFIDDTMEKNGDGFRKAWHLNGEKNGDGFRKAWHLNGDIGDFFDCGGERFDRVYSQESVSKDILDLLPSDPFGMDISTTFTAISSWLEDLEVGYRSSEVGTNNKDYQLFTRLSFIWNNAMRFQPYTKNKELKLKPDVFCELGECSVVEEAGDISLGFDLESPWKVGSSLSWGNVRIGDEPERCIVGCSGSSSGDTEAPHDALIFALGYLGLQDLLSAERVCRYMHSTIKSDPLLWRSIHVDQSLSEKITDDALLQLTSRSQGNLSCLSLMDCQKITDNCLKRILETNPRLTKLSVPGCTRISIEGIISSLKAFKSVKKPILKSLRIGGLYGVTLEHYEELKLLLDTESNIKQYVHRPHFYKKGKMYLSCDDERAIDIEMCPRCQNMRLVYDCPSEGCRRKETASQACRGCSLCIERCGQCGCCIDDGEYEETFALDWLCSNCSKEQSKCEEGQDQKG